MLSSKVLHKDIHLQPRVAAALLLREYMRDSSPCRTRGVGENVLHEKMRLVPTEWPNREGDGYSFIFKQILK